VLVTIITHQVNTYSICTSINFHHKVLKLLSRVMIDYLYLILE